MKSNTSMTTTNYANISTHLHLPHTHAHTRYTKAQPHMAPATLSITPARGSCSLIRRTRQHTHDRATNSQHTHNQPKHEHEHEPLIRRRHLNPSPPATHACAHALHEGSAPHGPCHPIHHPRPRELWNRARHAQRWRRGKGERSRSSPRLDHGGGRRSRRHRRRRGESGTLLRDG